MSTQITVLGLGQIGTSIGLALASQKPDLVRVGNDRELTVARQAEKAGAFDKTIINLHSAVENSPIIILALPVDEIEETLKIIAEDLQPGTVVVDTAPIKVPLLDTASKLLGPDRYYVTLSPTLNPAYLEDAKTGVEAARADLFKNSLMVITSAPGVHSGAIQVASDLAALLDATPFYADPLEADGLIAASHTLPILLAAALAHAAADQPGWREGRKLAGPLFALSTLPLTRMDESKQLGQTALLNRQNVVRVLDNAIAALQLLRSMVDQQSADALSEYLQQARESRETWLKQRASANWDAAPSQSMPTSGDMLGRLVGWRPKTKKK